MIECNHVYKTYIFRERSSLFSLGKRREIPALQDVSFHISQGEMVGLLGPNGAGKTTLLKILATLLLPDAGEAIVAGYNVVQHPREVRRRIGLLLPNDRSLFWKLTALENLYIYGGLYNLPWKEIKIRSKELLAQMELASFAHVAVEKFSTGMRKRLMLARALLHQPRVLILDEPTSGLDVQSKRDFWTLLKEITAKQGVTLLLATHDMEEAERVPQRLLIIHRGTLYANGSPEEIKSLAGEETRLIVDLPDHICVTDMHLPAEVLERIEKMDGYKRVILRASLSEWSITKILKCFPHILRVERREANLGDAFLKLTGTPLKEEETKTEA